MRILTMGLINNILISFVHFLFVVMDFILLMIAVKVVYDRWRPSWLKQAVDAIEPIHSFILNYAERIVMSLTRRTYSQKTLLLLVVICLSMARLFVASLL